VWLCPSLSFSTSAALATVIAWESLHYQTR